MKGIWILNGIHWLKLASLDIAGVIYQSIILLNFMHTRKLVEGRSLLSWRYDGQRLRLLSAVFLYSALHVCICVQKMNWSRDDQF